MIRHSILRHSRNKKTLLPIGAIWRLYFVTYLNFRLLSSILQRFLDSQQSFCCRQRLFKLLFWHRSSHIKSAGWSIVLRTKCYRTQNDPIFCRKSQLWLMYFVSGTMFRNHEKAVRNRLLFPRFIAHMYLQHTISRFLLSNSSLVPSTILVSLSVWFETSSDILRWRCSDSGPLGCMSLLSCIGLVPSTGQKHKTATADLTSWEVYRTHYLNITQLKLGLRDLQIVARLWRWLEAWSTQIFIRWWVAARYSGHRE
jgi:hypothetical protein